MEQDDEEFEKLLREIPHATSTPPNLDGIDRSPSSSLVRCSSAPGAVVASKQMKPAVSRELFADVYHVFQGTGEFHACANNSNNFSEPRHITSNCDGDQRYTGLTVEGGNVDSPTGQLNVEQLETQSRLQPLAQQEKRLSAVRVLGENNGLPLPQQHLIAQDESLSSAFSNLNFEGDLDSKFMFYVSKENRDGRRNDSGGESGLLQIDSTVLFTGLGERKVGQEANDSPGSITNSGDGFASHCIDIFSAGPLSRSSSAPISPLQGGMKNMLGEASGEDLSTGGVTYVNGVGLDGYANGGRANGYTAIGGAVERYTNGVSKINGGVHGETNGNGLHKYANGGCVEEAESVAYPRRGVTGLGFYSNGNVGRDHELYGNGRNGKICTNEGSRSFVDDHLAKLSDPAGYIDQQLHSYPAVVGFPRGPHGFNIFRPPSFPPPPSCTNVSYLPLNSHSQVASYLQAQEVHKMQLNWQRKEQQRLRMQQILLQHPQGLANLQNDVDPLKSYPLPNSLPSGPGHLYNSNHYAAHVSEVGTAIPAADWNSHLYQGIGGSMGPNHPAEIILQSGVNCKFFAQGFCGRGETCPFTHLQPLGTLEGEAPPLPSAVTAFPEAQVAASNTSEGKLGAFLPQKILTRRNPRVHPGSLGSPRSRKKDNGREHLHASVNGHHHPFVHPGSVISTVISEELDTDLSIKSVNGEQNQQQLKYASLDEVDGQIYFIAKDQHGCRFLQKKFEDGGPEDIQKIFTEIIEHIIELMTDPFGNYLVQKLLEVCSELQRMKILESVTEMGELINISLNMHGTRAVQKLIETLKSPQQIAMVISSLKSGVVSLIKDLNGNHVVQRCLQRLSTEDSQFIFDAAASHCVEIATHRHGCCVLQRCIDFAAGPQRQHLVAEIAANSLVLSQDPFGNYVVQYILDLGMPWASSEILARLEENYAFLSMQKFSSNVVEKCLKLAGEEQRAHIIFELTSSTRLGQLLQDPYANYVIQSALTVSKGTLHTALVEAIRPHIPTLRSSPYGKRIISRTNLKK